MRARIGAISGIPGEWRAAVARWWRLNTPLRSGDAPSADEEYLIYQTLIGAWPIEAERLRDYMVKAMREAGTTTNWVEPDEAHEAAVLAFCDALVGSEAFVADLERFLERIVPLGEAAALGQTLLKLTAPGVPDIYQGDELWDLALVDPDNRRPVDWELRGRLLEEVASADGPSRETAKMFLIHRALALRERRPEPFAGAYRPLDAGETVFAYARGEAVIVVVPIRADTSSAVLRVPEELRGPWRDALTGVPVELGGEMMVDELTGPLSLALLERIA